MQFSYYYGMESEQFRFYRIPKVLFTEEYFKTLSNDAKLLYGLMLERMSLSRINGWTDDKNRVYIYYTIDDIMSTLNLGKTTSIKVLSELDSVKGLGLIEKKKQGFGKPDLIYVKNFTTAFAPSDNKSSDDEFTPGTENELNEVQKMNHDEFRKQTSSGSDSIPHQVQIPAPNNTDTVNDTDINKPNPSINHRMKDLTSQYIELIRHNLDLENISFDLSSSDYTRYTELYHLVCDVVCVPREYIRINNYNCPYELVKSRFLSLTKEHLLYILCSLDKINYNVSNMRNYLLSALYNSIDTLNINMQHNINVQFG